MRRPLHALGIIGTTTTATVDSSGGSSSSSSTTSRGSAVPAFDGMEATEIISTEKGGKKFDDDDAKGVLCSTSPCCCLALFSSAELSSPSPLLLGVRWSLYAWPHFAFTHSQSPTITFQNIREKPSLAAAAARAGRKLLNESN